MERKRIHRTNAVVCLLLAVAMNSCAATEEEKGGGGDGLATSTASIVNGTEARNHPEACVVSFGNFRCSGALIAPNVVLTAGHCVAGQTSWRVTCPYSSDTATASATQGSVPPNYPNRNNTSNETIDDTQGSDIGLIHLTRSLAETRVGHVRISSGVAVGARVLSMGRIHNGALTSQMYASPTFSITSIDETHGYWAGTDHTVIESGDSGGPLIDTTTGEIVGVNSAGVDPADCHAGDFCDEWAVLAAASTWFQSTMRTYTGSTPAPTPVPTPTPAPTSGCGAQSSCVSCTQQPTCGWCNGHCFDGTASGGGACTSAAGNWDWLGSQCTPPDPCAAMTDCGSCTGAASCGWCDGRCATGTRNGPNAGTCSTTPWSWFSSQCR